MKKIGQLFSFLLVSLMFVTSCTEPRIEKDESKENREIVEVKDLEEEDALVADTTDVEPVAAKLSPPPEPIPPVDPIPPGPMPEPYPDPMPDPIKPIMPPPPPPLPERRLKEPEVIQFPDVEATYPGDTPTDNKNMIKFIQENLHYPEVDRENEIQGRVYVAFVVEKDGSLTNIEVIRGISQTMDREAVRIIRLMPKWIPAQSNGKIVRSRARLPITFTLH
ncbi:MAG: energy transducer TonB [Flavobacteriales bacterium]|nr:energy transducer TonB [Flavobacteriales bacterium]